VPPLQRALDLRPDLAERFAAYYGQLWSDRLVDPVLLELCRLRIAQLLGDAEQQMLRYRPALEAGLTEDKIRALAQYPSSPMYSDHERTCLGYAEQYLMDVHSITDADADRVKEQMTEPEFVAFTVALGLLEGVGRFRLMLGLSDERLEHPLVIDPPAPGAPVP